MNVKLPRLQFLHLTVGAAALPAVTRFAGAEAYPTRPVRLVVGTPAGLAVEQPGGVDVSEIIVRPTASPN